MERIKHLIFLAVGLLTASLSAAASSSETISWSRKTEGGSTIAGEAAACAVAGSHDVVIPASGGYFAIRGASGSTPSSIVFLKSGEKAAPAEWGVLPEGLTGVNGTVHENTLYISGITGDGSRTAVFTKDASLPAAEWKELTTVPGGPRGGAVMGIQNSGTNACLFVIGGSVTENGKTRVFRDGWRYDLILKKWNRVSTEFPAGIATAVPAGANHLLIAGKDAEGNAVLYRYHTITSRITEAEKIADKIGKVYGLSHDKLESLELICSSESGLPLVVTGAIDKGDRSMGVLNWIVIALYFIVLAGIGFYFARRQKNTNDYFKGGGRIPWWAAGLSLFGTALSAITFMAIPAKAFTTDWSYALFNMGIVLVAPVIVLVFIPYYRKLNITTAYQYLEIRFNSVIRVLCSLAFIIFQVGRMGIILFLPSIALNVVTGMDIFLCIGIMGICSIIYTMCGGIEAVVWTDALQVIILLGGAMFAVIYIAMAIPEGISGAIAISASDGKFSLGPTGFDLQDSTMWTVIIAAFFTNLTTYGTDQSMVQRYLTTDSKKAADKSVWTNALLTIPATVIFFFIGTALYAYYKTYPESLSITVNSGDAIFPWYIFTELPAGLSGLLISGIFAAAMSTLSGSMNSAATAYSIDIYPRLSGGRTASLRTARVVTCVAGCISLAFAVLMATWNIASLWDEFQKILGLILGSMGGLFMLGMLTKRANSGGAIIGIIVSVLVQFFVARFHTFHLLLYTASGFISCFVVGYVASFLFPGTAKRVVEAGK